MTFEVPAAKGSEPDNRFTFKVGDEEFSVPLLRYLDGVTVERIAEGEALGGLSAEAAQFWAFGSPDSPSGRAIRTLERHQFVALMDAYQKASGLKAGESSASTDS